MPFYDMLVMEQVLKFNILIITAKKLTLLPTDLELFLDCQTIFIWFSVQRLQMWILWKIIFSKSLQFYVIINFFLQSNNLLMEQFIQGNIPLRHLLAFLWVQSFTYFLGQRYLSVGAYYYRKTYFGKNPRQE